MHTAGRDKPGWIRRSAPKALLLPLVWIGFELVLTLLGVGGGADRAQALLPYQSVAYPLFVPQGEPPAVRYAAHEERLGSRTFALEKPPELLRIFCLGGSAMRGLGYSPNASIPSGLEACLRACGFAQRRWEVLNCGVIGLSSRQVRGMCEDVLSGYAPDLMVVCTGNNEFLELHAQKYQELSDSGLWSGLLAWIRDLRSFHVLRALLPRRAPIGPSAGAEIRLTASAFMAEVEITEEEIRNALAEYRSNLEAIAESCKSAGVPLVLMTVPANLRWNDPQPEEDWDERVLADWKVDAATWPATREGRAALLLGEIETRLARAPSSERSALAFLRGKCEEALGDVAAARRAYVLAQDADEHRRRTTSAMNASVASVAREHGAQLLDTVAFFQELQPIPDFRLMYDHIHYTPEGALRVAGRLAQEAVALLLPESAGACGGLAAFQTRTLEHLAERIRSGEDAPAVDEWLGFCFDAELVVERDLWKYQRQVQELRAIATAQDGPDAAPLRRGKALTYLGNALSFEAGKQAEARACYEQALELVPAWKEVIRENLARLAQ